MNDSGATRPHPAAEQLLDLLDRWQSLESQGRTVSAADVCTDCPELTEELDGLARFARQVETLAADTADRSTDGALFLPTLAPPAAETAAPGMAARDRYAIEERLGQGGMGAVYQAHDRVLGRTVALKVIRPDALTPGMRARFEAEARAVARLDHPHIVKVFDVGEGPMPGEPAPVPFLTLEFVEGGSLGKRLGRKPLGPAEAARLVALLARAMQHAHDRGIVHRDLKPDNILLAPASSVAALNTSLGCPKITDFGLARQVSADERLTKPGAMMGTPDYMAPEQADGHDDIGPAADVWALGVILYRLLTGSMPFASPSLVELLHQICRKEPVSPEQLRPEVPAGLAAIVRDCLRKPPGERPTAGQLAERLERFQEQDGVDGGTDTSTDPWLPDVAVRPRRWRRRAGVLAAVAGVLAVAGLAWALWPTRPREQHQEQRANNNTPPGLNNTPPVVKKQTDKKPPVVVKPLRIRPIQVMHFEEGGIKAVERGRIGEGSFATRRDDTVTLTVELSEAAYFYVIGFNFDGKEQLLWPVDDAWNPSEQVVPPRQQKVRYPAGEKRVYLDDPARSGLQVYVVAASRRPLPAFAEWRAQRGGMSWKALPAGETVWEADAKGTYAVVKGLGADRGSIREARGVPPLSGLCRSLLGGGVEAVEAIAFPVLPKEGK